jgi:peroxiredoxin
LKLVAEQKSKEWDQPRADRAAWRRVETVWLSTRLGVAQRVERRVERREPAHREATYQSLLRYDLEEPMQYPGELFDQREQEIRAARAFADEAAPLMATPAKNGPQFDALLKKIAHHVERKHETPYREALLQLKRQVEAAQRGETPPPAATPVETVSPTSVAAIGAAAPDFTAPDLVAGGTNGLRRLLGKPVLMVFYNPSSRTTGELLRFAQKLGDAHHDLTVVGFNVAPDAEQVKKQRADLGLTFGMIDGSGLRTSYAVDGTPRMVLLDAKGVVRGAFSGWGRETPGDVMEEVRRWLPQK